jgi:hypothetical protein
MMNLMITEVPLDQELIDLLQILLQNLAIQLHPEAMGIIKVKE